MKVHGHCHCGSITYEAEVDPARASACHCTDCQALSGSPFRVSVPAARETLQMRGQLSTYVKIADSGNRRVQAFCGNCGSSIYSAAEVDPAEYNLRVGCLDERASLPPLRQIWCRSSMPWSTDLRELPKTPRQ